MMKKFFIVAVLVLAGVTASIFGSMTAFALAEDIGFVIPSGSGIYSALSTGDAPAISMVEVDYDDVIYQSVLGYYLGEERTQIDIDFPMFVSGGASLRFLTENSILLSPAVELLPTYEGMYLNDGQIYNRDMSIASYEEYIMLALPNGLYMNAMTATLTTRVGEHTIPANSVLYMDESVMRWYSFNGVELGVATEEEILFEATITIGDYTYAYQDLLEIMGLISEVATQSNGAPTL